MRGGDNACVETSAAVYLAVLQRHPTPDRSGFPIFAALYLTSSHVKRIVRCLSRDIECGQVLRIATDDVLRGSGNTDQLGAADEPR